MKNLVDFSELDVAAIKAALSMNLKNPSDFWYLQSIAPIKKKIKTELLARTKSRCCYCRRSLMDHHGLTIDVEHILPIHKFRKYSFSVKNLSVSCKRCNMAIKNRDYSFFTPGSLRRPFRSKYYTIFHPNLDQADAHLRLCLVQIGGTYLVKYHFKAENQKASCSYEYFELEALEKNSVDVAQGGEAMILLETVPVAIRNQLKTLLQNE